MRLPTPASFRTKLLLFVAVAVSVPALLMCAILGYQLDRQARIAFADKLGANLETFSLILDDADRNLREGITRAAADNTLQVTLELDIRPQLAKYLESQRRVLGVEYLGVFDKDGHAVANSAADARGGWRLAEAAGAGATDCQGDSSRPIQRAGCNDTAYTVAVVPVSLGQEGSLGDASSRTAQSGHALGFLVGAAPVATDALLNALRVRQIDNPLLWLDDRLIYSNLRDAKVVRPERRDGTAQQQAIGRERYLLAAKTAGSSPGALTYAVAAPLASLSATLFSSVMTVAAVGLVLIAATLAGVAWAAKGLLAPIERLREGVARIGQGNLAERISVTSGDEIQALAEQFNDMAGRLERSYSELEDRVEVRTKELARSVAELRALGEVTRAVNSSLDLEQVLSTIVAKAVEISGTDAGAIYVFSSHRQEFRLRATYGMTEELINEVRAQHIRLGESAVGQAAVRREPVQVPDLLAEPANPMQELLLRGGFRALLVVPLLRSERVIGALVVRRREAGIFPRASVDLLQTFAAQSVLAIQNARLFSELEEKSRQVEEASRHKSQFLANMSHELRTPMNAVLGFSEMLADGLYGELPEKAMKALERIRSNGKHLLGLINDVLDLAKIESGQMTLAIDDYSLPQVVKAVLASTESLARAKGLALQDSIEPGLPQGRGDERRLTQVLLNLAGNAIKFTEEGSICIAAKAAGDSFEIEVRDTGPGIAEDDQKRIFEEFQQVDNSNTREKGGTGLGLAISRKLIEMHGGTLAVQSALGQGSTFRIKLPVRAAERQEAA